MPIIAELRLDVFQSRRVLVAALLGFSSGVPLQLTGLLLSTRLTDLGLSLKTIGAAAMFALPYNFKWTWAPILDRVTLPFLGRRRGWLLVFQLALAGAIVWLGSIDPRGDLPAVAGAAFLVAALSASQDVVVDAFNADSLRPEERAAGSSAYLVGYKAAMLITGIAILWYGGVVGWQAAYATCAGLMVVGVVATLIAEEPPGPETPPSMLDVLWKPIVLLLRQRRILFVLAFVGFYRFAEFLIVGMIAPFLKGKLHFTTNEFVVGYQIIGFAGTAVGGAVGSMLVARHGARRCLLPFGFLFGGTNLLWLAVLASGASLPMLIGATFFDQAAGAMGAGAFVAYMMSRVDRAVSATQYAMLTSLSSIGARLLGWVSGSFVASHGWPWFWIATTLITLPALALVPLLPSEDRAAPGST